MLRTHDGPRLPFFRPSQAITDMTKKVALITGVTGQDGAYLAEILLSKGYVVHGIKRRSSSFNTARVDHLYADPHESNVRFSMHYGDMTDATNLIRIIQETKPSEIYNLAAQSHVQVSFETPQRETTPFYPRSPYAAAKLYGYWIVVNYREAYGIYASNGILFNHESPIRGETFVTRKITRAVAAIHLGLQDRLYLGNLDAKRDWGHARDYAEGMWMILQQDQPDDFILATGESYTVREFVERAFERAGHGIRWTGEGTAEKGIDKASGRVFVEVDKRYFRPTEVDILLGDPSKARAKLGWRHRTSFDQLVNEMVDKDLELMARDGNRWKPYE